MFGVRIQSLPAASAAPATVAADEEGGGGTNVSSPQSSHHSSSTSSPGATSGAGGALYTVIPNGKIQIYRSSVEYASAMVDALASSGQTTARSASDLLPPWRGKVLLVFAVPKSHSPDEFISFCGVHIKHASDICIIRNDAVKDRYSALLTFINQKSADDFYLYINGWDFTSRGEVCHALFVAALEFSTETASSIPIASTELPTCPICIERLGQNINGLVAERCNHSSQCSCFIPWANSSCVVCLSLKQQEEPSCAVCQNNSGLSMCLLCGFIGCERYGEGHTKSHRGETGHSYSLDLETGEILDFSISDAEHTTESKFGDMLRIRVENAIDEPNWRFARAFEAQRQYYKTLFSEAEGGSEQRIAEAASKAVNDKVHELQLKLENAVAEKEEAVAKNKKLQRSRDLHTKLVTDIEKREIEELDMKDKKIHGLEEEIEDYKQSLKLKESVKKNANLKGATLVPLGAPNMSDSHGKSRRRAEGKRR